MLHVILASWLEVMKLLPTTDIVLLKYTNIGFIIVIEGRPSTATEAATAEDKLKGHIVTEIM